MKFLALFFLLLFCSVGCGSTTADSDETSNGGSTDGGSDTGDDTEDSLEPTLSSIQSLVFTPSCATSGCHSSVSASGGLSLADGESFAELVGVLSTEAVDLELVSIGDPDASYLINKLDGTQATVGGSGSSMPKNATDLTDEEIFIIMEWIENGALDN